MDIPGLLNSITNALIYIDAGRKGFATRGKEQEGRIFYEDGIDMAMTAFKESQTTADPQTIILAEFTFLTQEFQFCDKTDIDTIDSLTLAISSFDDAFLALKAVEGLHYETVEQAIPHSSKYRVKSYPRDAYHIAADSHKKRLKNILKTPGLDLIEKALLKQRLVNLSTGQGGYVELQRKALTKEK